MRVVWNRIVYRDPRHYAAFPSAATLSDGTVLVAFRRARDHRWLRGADLKSGDADFDAVDHLDSRSHLALVRLTPDLEPAGPAEMLPPDPDAGDQDASLLVLRDGRVMMSGFCYYPVSAQHVRRLQERGVGMLGSTERTGVHYIFWGGYTRLSTDDGRSWTPHAFLPPVPGQADLVPGVRPHFGGPVRGRAVERPDGTVLQAAYAVRPGTGRAASLLHASADGGLSWDYRGVIAEDPAAGFYEPGLQTLPDGRLIAFHRTGGLDDRLATAVSDDEGRSWSAWTRHEVIGHPYDACPVGDGRLLLVYGHRHPPFGVRARLWDPAGEAIDEANEFVIRDDAPSPDTGYPWATMVGEGRALVVYYICDDAGIRHIAASLLDLAG